MTIYNEKYYTDQIEGSYRSAHPVLSTVFKEVQISSVLDLGCGRGLWLKASRDFGASKLVGVDGAYNRGKIDDDEIQFISHDLNKEIKLNERFDLAISLEVAEHCSPTECETFVANICRASDLVVFGAAIPGQGGLDHQNENWQSFWAGLFSKRDYVAFDIIRPQVWSDKAVEFWYRQNTIMYAKRDSTAFNQLKAQGYEFVEDLERLDLIHPDLFKLYTQPNSVLGSIKVVSCGLQGILDTVPTYLRRILTRKQRTR